MTRKIAYVLMIFGCVCVLAAITFWIDTLTSTEPVGLGQQIRDWLTPIVGLVTLLFGVNKIKKNDNPTKPPNFNSSGENSQFSTGEQARNIRVDGPYIEKAEKVEFNITQPSDGEEEKKKRKYEPRNKHEFEAPRYSYQSIQDTAIEFQEKLEKLPGGYIGVFGPPGSGKSTFLTQTLRTLPIRSIRYYAYVSDAQDPSILRGESINFFHDTTLQIQTVRNNYKDKRPDSTDKMALTQFFYQQLSLLGKDYETTNTKTIILIDGLDHIAREQHPERSLIEDLPLSTTIPNGVYIVLGSQTSDLFNLPFDIQNTLSKNERTIWMGKLSSQNVFEIIHQTLPEISNDFDSKIYQIVDGHPLSLIYLLNSLHQLESPNEYAKILEETTTYQGNIDDHYFSHWKKIEDDLVFAEFLGLLARIRGPIRIKWVAEWAEEQQLRKLNKIFGQYFLEDNLGRWEFFHNSFRIFLDAKTADHLPGRTSEQIDQEFHLKLAHRYEKYNDWETLYHYYKAGEHKHVIDIAQYDWFRTQTESLRPIDAIETDVRLAMKSAGKLLDTIALIRYTLIGGSLQQRSYTIKDTELPHLLIEAGRSDIAIDYARDGARLRLGEKAALSFCRNLYNADLKREATRIFELAEPLEYLSGRPISEKKTEQRDLYDLLAEWVKSASLIRSPIETAQIIRRIQAIPSWHDKDKDIFQESLILQNRLLHIGALSCCERNDWNGWQVFISSLHKERDHIAYYFTLLRTIEHLRRINENDHARNLLNELLNMDKPKSFGESRNKTSNLLSIVESIYFLEIDDYQVIAKKWFEKVEIIPLSDNEFSRDNSPKLIELHFRYSRLKFLLDSGFNPEKLVKEAESQTVFGEHEEDEGKLARRQLALIAYTLAKLWGDAHIKITQQPNIFLKEIRWIFDLIETNWNSISPTFHVQTERAKENISEYIVICAAKQGANTLQAVKNEFSYRWENNPKAWWAGVQREIILTIADSGQDYIWAKGQLERIEIFMLRGLDLSGRVNECEKQAKAWLHLGEKTRAMLVLHQLVKSARGIYSEKDYQLNRWASWLRKVNLLEPVASSTRIKKFLAQAFSVDDTTSDVDETLLSILQTVFDISPHKSIQLYKNLLERKAITHDTGLTKLLFSILESENPPIWDAYWTMENLIFPLSTTTSPDLIKLFIGKANAVFGKETALKLAKLIAKKIQTDVLENYRAEWANGVDDGLNQIGISSKMIEIQPYNEREISNSSIDYKLHLLTGENFTLQEAILFTLTIGDFSSLFKKEQRESNSYFKWHELANSLIKKVSTIDEINEICQMMDNRINGFSKDIYLVSVYTSASERFYELGYSDYSEKMIRKAVNLSKPSSWSFYIDGGIKYAAMKQMIKILGGKARREIIMLYMQDLTEHNRYPEEMIKNLDHIVNILFDDIPYLDLWPDVDNYLDELFSGVIVDTQPELDVILNSSIEISPDDANAALAELLILYLDFPAYSVSNEAVKACSKSVLSNNLPVKNALRLALGKHDQLVKQGLITLEIVSIQKSSEISFFYKELTELKKSPNMLIRMIATKILSNTPGQSSYPPIINRDIPPIYSLHLPDITIHHTEDIDKNIGEPILLGDPALLLQPLDIQARQIAERADVPESNLLYHAVEKLKELESQRTWLFNGLALEPNALSRFLNRINISTSYNKPKISPCRHSNAHIAAELYDSKKLSSSDLPFLSSIFDDYDPNLFLLEAKMRPNFIEGMGGITHSISGYLNFPKDWEQKLEASLPLLKSHSTDNRIILGEWTHLKQLQDGWPIEERFSLLRATSSYTFWDDIDLSEEGLPFANKSRLHISKYINIMNYPEKELVIAHNGYRYQMKNANWVALNPKVGFDLGWKPTEDGYFSWRNKNNQLVAESIYWQDGNFDSNSWRERVEVGYGWLVLISEDGYKEIYRRYGIISRGGVIKRRLKEFELESRIISSILTLP